jgi:hypothetical protein
MQGLILQDLKVAAGAIELGAQRGAFRANEMKIIGEVYEKLTAFIRSAEPQTEATEAPAEGAEQPAAEVTETPAGE